MDIDRTDMITSANVIIGYLMLKVGKYEEARKYFYEGYHTALGYHSRLHIKETAYGLFDCYLNLDLRDSALLFLDVYHAYSDSLREEKYNETIEQLNYDFQLEKEREQMAREKEMILLEKKRGRLIFIILVSLLIFILAITVTLWYVQKLRLQRSELIRENLRLENENISSRLEKRNRELTTNVMYLLKKNEFITTISQKLKAFATKRDPGTKAMIAEIIHEMEISIKRDAWKEFEVRFNNIHRDFYASLNDKHPGLSPNELRLSAFLRLNMTSKEISSITFQSQQSIKIARYRLRKKLGLPRGKNLISYLNQF
jgi:DNA-binding CsgD family transcriptional regulator